MGEGIIDSKSKRFLVYCFSFISGIAFFSGLEIKIPVFTGIFIFSIIVFLLIIFWTNKKIIFFLFVVLNIIVSSIRYSLVFPKTKVLPKSSISNIGYIAGEPDIRTDRVNYIVKTEKFNKVFIKQSLYPRFEYGDKVEIKCKIVEPKATDDFRYDMYLARYRVFALCENGNLQKIQGKDGNIFMQKILAFKTIIAQKINLLWPEPYASFMAGLLYGYRGGLGTLQELFSITGVTHIVAISGYNISLIATILSTLFVKLYVRRQKAFWGIVLGIIIFVIFTGMSASVVRAGIMGIIALLAKQMGRRSKISGVMALAATIMIISNPLILLYDAGFQLSFLSTLGLVYLSPILEKYISFVPEKFSLRENMNATLSATIATLPLILSQFGRLSIVSLPVNMLILWTIPWIMMIGFFAVAGSFVWFNLGQIIAYAAYVGMSYIVFVVKLFAKLPFAAINIQITSILMIGSYVLMVFFIKQKNRQSDQMKM